MTITLDTRLEHLRNANRVRLARAAVRRHIFAAPTATASAERAAAIVRDPGPDIGGMTAYDLVASIRRVGRQTAGTILRQVGVSDHRTLDELTERQRVVLIARVAVIGTQRRQRKDR